MATISQTGANEQAQYKEQSTLYSDASFFQGSFISSEESPLDENNSDNYLAHCCSKVSEAFNRYREQIGVVNTVALSCFFTGAGLFGSSIITGFGFIPGTILMIVGAFLFLANLAYECIRSHCCNGIVDFDRIVDPDIEDDFPPAYTPLADEVSTATAPDTVNHTLPRTPIDDIPKKKHEEYPLGFLRVLQASKDD